MSGVRVESVATNFSRLGWAGMGIQAVLAMTPIIVFCWVFLAKAVGTQPPLRLTDHLAFLGLAILVFTTFWSYRYTRVGERMADAARRPARRSVVNVLWVGLGASALGIVVSMMLLIAEVVRLLILVLATPQAGVPVIQTATDSRAAWVSAIDVVSLLADVSTLGGELVILGFTLWLLFRFSRVAADYDQARPTA